MRTPIVLLLAMACASAPDDPAPTDTVADTVDTVEDTVDTVDDTVDDTDVPPEDRDADDDGFPASVDCDDTDPDVNHAADEIPYDGIDNDCRDGDACDVDGDGHLEDGAACGGDDCDDADGAVSPSAVEVPYDGVDDDCSGADLCDVDGDGHLEDGAACGGDDCDDADGAVSPSEVEVTWDGVDNDCDPATLDDPGPQPTNNFWVFASPWETRDQNNAEIERIYVDHQAWVVVYEDDNGLRGDELFHERVSQFSSNRILLENPERWEAWQTLHLAVYDDQGIRSQFDPADPLLVDKDGAYMEAVVDLNFISSTTVEDSIYYDATCTIQQWQENRTDLPVDCRCNSAQTGGFPVCWPPSVAYMQGHEWSTGPRLADINNVGRVVGGGFLDETARKYIVAMAWNDPTYTQSVGTIWAIDVDTGDRRVVSGTIDTATGYQTVGGGYESNVTVSGVLRHTATLPYLWDVQPGPDGYWYAYASDTQDNVEITRIDPATGDRTLVWHKDVAGQGHTMGQCTSDRVGELSVQFTSRSFTMDPSGNFYLSFHNPSDGDGIVRIPADGSTCEVISRLHSATRPDVGGGYTFQSQNIRGMGWVNGDILAYTVLGDRLIAFDPVTGDRTLVSSVDDQVGTGHPSIGENWLIWDDQTGLLWTSGGAADQFVVVDLTTGDRQNLLQMSSSDPLYPGGHPVAHDQRGPIDPGTWSRERFYWHPDNPDHVNMVVNGMALVTFELHTSNSYIFSM